MKNKKLHITLFALLIWSFSFSQQFTNYSTKEGLPSNHIYKVIQDSRGFIWIATDKGLVKYNGTTFKTFTTKEGLSTNDVWDLHATPDGRIWYQSKASKVGYIENDSVHAFKSEEKGEILYSLFTNQIDNEIILSDGRKSHKLINEKWKKIVNNNINEDHPKNYIQHKNISYLSVSSKRDSILIYNKNKKVVKYLKGKDILFKNHKRGQLTDSLYYWVCDDSYRILNLNTLESRTHFFKDEVNIKNSQYVRINLSNNALQISGRGFVSALDNQYKLKNTYLFPDNIDAHFGFIDASENIWLCTFSNGLFKLPKVKRNIKYALNNKKVNYLDHINNKIIATVYNEGFYVFDSIGNSFEKFLDLHQFLYQPVFLKGLKTEFYICKKNTISITNGLQKTIEVAREKGNPPSEVNRNLIYYKKFIYGLNSVGISKINPNTLSVVEDYRQLGINSILVFNEKLLVATTNGLKEFKNKKFEFLNFKNELLDKSILNIHKLSDTEILLNTDGFGAYVSDLKNCKQLPNSEFLIVNNAFVTSNTIWLATNTGILKYKKVNGNYQFDELINTFNGLSSKNINDVLIYENNIIASTNSGVVILPENYQVNQQTIDLYIENATYNIQKILDNSNFFFTENNSVLFEISTIDYSENTDDFSFQYKLEPIQNEWTETSSKIISFNALLPDNYKLSIRTNTIEKTLNFTIKPLWWQTTWFKILAVFLFLSVLSYFIWFLIKLSSKKEKNRILQEQKFSELQLKALRSQMNPHFVFNSLAAIQYYINENDFETSEYYLVKFSKLIRQFFDMSTMSKISIEEELRLLTNYLDIEKLRFKEKLSYKIDVNPSLENKEIPSMLLQPIVENAINHGIFNKLENGIINIKFSAINENEIKIEIIDDGVGFEKTLKKSKKIKSSQVLKDRIHFLNMSKVWEIQYFNEMAFPEVNYVGNKSIFIIKKI